MPINTIQIVLTAGFRGYGTYTLTLPSNKEYSVPQIKMLLKEIERGISKKISIEEWRNL